MKIRSATLLLISVAIGLPVAGYVAYLNIFPTYEIRYRLTFSVEAGGETLESSGVVAVTYDVVPGFLLTAFMGHPIGIMCSPDIRVNVGAGRGFYVVNHPPMLTEARSSERLLFTDGGSLSWLTVDVVVRDWGYNDQTRGFSSVLTKIQRSRKRLAVPLAMLPMIVTFSSPDERNSVVELNPLDLSPEYGDDVRINSVNLQVTDDPPSKDLSSWPAWLRADKIEPMLVKVNGRDSPSSFVGYGSFRGRAMNYDDAISNDEYLMSAILSMDIYDREAEDKVEP